MKVNKKMAYYYSLKTKQNKKKLKCVSVCSQSDIFVSKGTPWQDFKVKNEIINDNICELVSYTHCKIRLWIIDA